MTLTSVLMSCLLLVLVIKRVTENKAGSFIIVYEDTTYGDEDKSTGRSSAGSAKRVTLKKVVARAS